MPAAGALWRPPTGNQILFRGGDPTGDGALYLIRPDGSGLTKLVLPSEGIGGPNDFSHGIGWSPDGRRLAYETVDTHDTSANGAGLRIHVADIDPEGTVLLDRRLEFDPQADDELNPAWFPGGDRIAFQTREGSSDYLSVAPVPGPALHSETGTAQKIGPASRGGGGIGYEVAPDGRSLLVLFWTEQTTWRYDLDTLTATPAALGPLDVSSFQRLAP
jgi:dipeptidyl aminopeptidase/acylaminoacyl peptidase